MAGARRRSGGGPGFGQWLALGCAVVVILGLTFTLGLLVGRQWARGSGAAVTPSVSDTVRKASTAPSRRGGIAAETMADRVPEPTEKLTFYQTLTEPLNAGGSPRTEAKPVTVKVSAPAPEPKPTAAKVSAPSTPAAVPVTAPAPSVTVSLPPAPGKGAVTPPPVAKAPTPPGHAHATSPWTVQVGAFKNRRQAEDTRQQLAAAGLEAYVASVAAQDGQPRFRVRVGTYRTREEAAVVAERIRAQRSLTAFVTPQ
ncbi:MAG TPA: SPOR domain-containing protein [Methylomirabilota bacterium]|nr:SPOR domain-containing protein [Methylomirabilota bacterium]